MSDQEPVAWGVEAGGRFLASYTCEDEESAREQVARFAACVPTPVVARVVPLYRQPQPALTAEEREAVERVSVAYELLPTEGAKQVAAILRGLLERTK